jgi:dTDP-4-amino-4,6-dideoxygalactose transaminase
MDALQAALIRVKLKRLDEYTKKRQQNAALYNQLLTTSGLAAPSCGEGCTSACPRGVPAPDAKLLLPVECQSRHIYNQYVVRVLGEGARDRLQAALKERGVGTEVYYPIPMHLQECFAELGHRAGDFPHAESAAKETLALPIFPELEGREIEFVVRQIGERFDAVTRR